MKAYSLDLRERVAAACAKPKSRIAQVSAQFNVSTSFIDKLLRRQRTTGSLAALPHKSGPEPMLDAAGLLDLSACWQQAPDATLDETRLLLAAVGGPTMSRTAVWRATEAVGWGRKKKASTPRNATPNAS